MPTLVTIDDDWPAELRQGLAALGLVLAAGQQQALLGYLGLLAKWNRAYNLTAVREPAVMVRRQLLDSLSISRWLGDGPVLDVGTGAGLPGIPLAIAHPRVRFSLLDTNSKKTRFVRQAVGELGLANVEVLQSRVEALQRTGHYATITSRAFASLADMVRLSRHLLADGGCWLAMKGTDPVGEIAALPDGIVAETIALAVPGETAARHLVRLREG